jgi:hypothetical protein
MDILLSAPAYSPLSADARAPQQSRLVVPETALIAFPAIERTTACTSAARPRTSSRARCIYSSQPLTPPRVLRSRRLRWGRWSSTETAGRPASAGRRGVVASQVFSPFGTNTRVGARHGPERAKRVVRPPVGRVQRRSRRWSVCPWRREEAAFELRAARVDRECRRRS